MGLLVFQISQKQPKNVIRAAVQVDLLPSTAADSNKKQVAAAEGCDCCSRPYS
jgi:hypothetical protein